MRAWLHASLVLAAAAVAHALNGYTASPPGGLSPEQVPQFVLFTHDDAVNSESYAAVRSIADGRVVNGCPVPATMFVKVDGTDCDDLKDLYDKGYEVADHSISHQSFLDMGTSEVEDEILGARRQLADCGIPESAVVGLRTPFLRTNPEVRQIAADNGFLYDSTLRVETDDPAERVWPWDLGDGIPSSVCDSSSTNQVCSSDESWPGMYEVPVWVMSALGQSYHMNYADDGAVDVYAFLKDAFDASYNGNRAPMPLFVHTPWIEEFDRGLRDFMDYASAKPDVYFVTIRQLLAWMQNPVPLDRLTPEALGCGNPGGAGPAAPVGTNALPTPSPSPPASSPAVGPSPEPGPGPSPAVAPSPDDSFYGEEGDLRGMAQLDDMEAPSRPGGRRML